MTDYLKTELTVICTLHVHVTRPLECKINPGECAKVLALRPTSMRKLQNDCYWTLWEMQGVMELLKRTGVKISGKRAVVIGRSNIVGMPVALLLQAEDATVTVVHSRTPAPEVHCNTITSPTCVKADTCLEMANLLVWFLFA